MMSKWFRSYGLMVKWVFLSNRTWLTLNLVSQLTVAVAFIIGIAYFYPEMTTSIAKYLTTGSPTLVLLTVGLSTVPQVIANMRSEGTFDYIWSLPVPRMAHIAADATNMFGTMIPGILLSIILGKYYFGFDLHVSWMVIPAVLLIASCATFGGYSLAFAVPKPMMVPVITQLTVFFLVMFSPVMFPSNQLPGFLQAIHRVLPIKYMANLMRGTLTDIPVNLGLSFAVVGAWLVGTFIVTFLMVRRRN
jgi:ABC-2 type transport system permease protein